MTTNDEVKNAMRIMIAEAMYMEIGEVEDDQMFSDFGLESVTLVKVVTKMCDKYSCSIEVRDLLPHQTLNEASSFIHSKIT